VDEGPGRRMLSIHISPITSEEHNDSRNRPPEERLADDKISGSLTSAEGVLNGTDLRLVVVTQASSKFRRFAFISLFDRRLENL
jgi:hypothetical protein